jgi:hypothetical protein
MPTQVIVRTMSPVLMEVTQVVQQEYVQIGGPKA